MKTIRLDKEAFNEAIIDSFTPDLISRIFVYEYKAHSKEYFSKMINRLFDLAEALKYNNCFIFFTCREYHHGIKTCFLWYF